VGNGNTTNQSSPVAVAGVLAGKTVTSLTNSTGTLSGNGGYDHTCAIAAGTVYCWGYNGSGQLGNGNTTNQSSPVAVAGTLAGKTVTTLTTRASGTCALAAGTVYCWGYNGFGQVGNGNTTNQSSPVAVAGVLVGKTVTALSHSSGTLSSNGGYDHTCAIAAGTVYCWGYNLYGQLGNGNTTNQSSPVAVAGVLVGKTVTSLTTRGFGTCALAAGTVYCWGYNGFGQVGDGGTTNQSSPVAVAGVLAGKTVTVLIASTGTLSGNGGYDHTCALAAGTVYCWGYNLSGQLGNGNTTNQSSPVTVAGALAGKTVSNSAQNKVTAITY
jgi:hypothetical protein